jgi:hypothetical protein
MRRQFRQHRVDGRHMLAHLSSGGGGGGGGGNGEIRDPGMVSRARGDRARLEV